MLGSHHLSAREKYARQERTRYRKNKVPHLFYPEDEFKNNWDLVVSLVLIVSSTATPLHIAFGEIQEPLEWQIVNLVVDLIFTLDIMVIFNSAYHDEDFVIVEDRKKIAVKYSTSWLFIDVLAVVPFDALIAGNGNYEDIVRITRIGRMYKLVKMTRLLRLLKIAKGGSKLLKQVNEILKIGLGFERLFFFILFFILLCHIVSCLLLISAEFGASVEDDGVKTYENTWLNDDYILSLDETGKYITAFYYTITTISTVGYGDLHGTNTLERAFGSLIMLIGVISFSFATGSLSSIL